MFFRILADMVMIFHFIFILYALFGGLLGLWKKWALFCHLPFAIWIILIEFMGWICPLTPLENYLRIKSGSQGYSTSFIEHYLMPVIYPPQLTTEIQILLGFVALIINVLIYTFVLFRSKNSPK